MTTRLEQVAKKLSNEIEFLQGRTKGSIDELIDKKVTLTDYDWMTKKDRKGDSTFPCFIIDEVEDKYYFGGSDLTRILQGIDAEGLKEDLQKDGLPMKVHEKVKTKDGNDFTKYELFPKN